MRSRLVFQLIIGVLLLLAGGHQAATGKYLPFQRVGLGAPRSPGAIRVLGTIGVALGVVLVILTLTGVSVFHLLGR